MENKDRIIEVQHDLVGNLWDWPLERNDGIVKVVNTADYFEVGFHVPQFAPQEIDVKIIHDELVISCHHDEREDQYGRISREIRRAYHLPRDVDILTLKSVLHKDGVLVISAKKKA
uniref:SHSP domain-containing protein n=1 Tax=Romanomermis culicivorax TaxID=13658 RepID=A0A915K566_ROMCU